MRVYKEIGHVVFDDNNINNFTNGIAKCVREAQDKNMQVEIQYSNCATKGKFVFSALILAYTEE